MKRAFTLITALLVACTYHLDVDHAAKDLVFDVTYCVGLDAGGHDGSHDGGAQ
jgi:hypothetical protein